MVTDPNRRRILQLAGAMALIPILPRQSRAAMPALTGSTMGTQYRVHINHAPKGLYLPKVKRRIEQVLESVDSLMSTYRPNSEISLFNVSPSTDWQVVSPDTARVVGAALVMQQNSYGAYSPAAGPLVDYWGFGPYANHAPDVRMPPPAEILSRVIEAGIELQGNHLKKSHPQAALDLNAIAKGHAVDGVVGILQGFGVHDYLVEIGGEVCVKGDGPDGDGWSVGLEHPSGGILAALKVDQHAIATSGDYTNFFTRNGQKYSHLIDPRLGNPIRHDLTMVSVAADSTVSADAWATALLVLGLEEGRRLAEQHSIAALFLQRLGDEYRQLATPAMNKLITRRTGVL